MGVEDVRTIPDVISSLKSAFRASDFDEAESILLYREDKLKREIEEKEREKEVLEEGIQIARLDRINLKSELRKFRDHDNQIIIALKKRNCELESAKSRVEVEAKIYKKKLEELSKKVLWLETHLVMLKSRELPASPVSYELLAGKGNGSCDNSEVARKFAEIKSEADAEVEKILERPVEEKSDVNVEKVKEILVKTEVGVIDDSSLHCQRNGNGENCSGPSENWRYKQKEGIIEIFDSDGDTARKNSSAKQVGTQPFVFLTCTGQGAGTIQNGTDVRKRKRDLQPEDRNGSYMKHHPTRCKRKWEFEVDMVSAFCEDDELCMKAVCALCRVGISSIGHSTSESRGFNKKDEIRGNEIAKFLTDGDPEKKLQMKSAKELVAHDEKALVDCKRLAIAHSKQLFKMYQQEDHLF